ncbi:hypothetical protein NM688_g2799 [Phlebia brevispora]|uniref:Uncharacterized protein n=1 Tax=Phlebia brevispora TaxID=194682 RepID=A0ACC1T7C4_9APHY|nr:hypothetical protein NM688_g2799 [Phlebia brevispora]
MRNLSLLSTVQQSLGAVFSPSTTLSAITLDLDEDALYVAAERQTDDADVEIEVFKLGRYSEGNVDYDATPELAPIAMLRTQAYLATNPWSSPFGRPLELVSFKLLPDTRTLVWIMRGGEIATASLEDDPISPDVVGNVDAGILAASWSPDDSALVLATGDEKLILMTSAFDVVSESPLHPTDFGDDAPINVGWGSKQTQFHGSLGKAAAQAPKPSLVGSSPDDDQLPRISWRGDGQFFVVSTLSPQNRDDPTSSTLEHRRRVIRTYSHAGGLQSTSEPTPGLEHTISWRPSGNWVVSTQRYGFPGGGEGKEGRHDVVMFERNGLRRLQFSIDSVISAQAQPGDSGRKWGYRVREVGWSSDSNILSLWIEGDEGDLVQLWTVSNYHWYLKHEIAAPPTLDGHPDKFTSVTWHPEDASTIILTTSRKMIRRSYVWDTFASGSNPPNDSASVAVLDGGSILLTPFRSQNVPPPMSSIQFPLAPVPVHAPKFQTRLPVQLSFTWGKDILVALWETGCLKLTDLHTRLGPGQGKVMDPQELWVGFASENSSISRNYRQALAISDAKVDDIWTVLALSSVNAESVQDVLSVVVLQSWEVQERFEIDLPQRNGRLIPSDRQVWWQSPDGEIVIVDLANRTFSPVSKFPRFSPWTVHVTASSEASKDEESSLFVGLTPSGSLTVANEDGTHQLLAANANSFTISSSFLVFTTTAHVAHFAPLVALGGLLQRTSHTSLDALPQWETRRVERGSRIVTAVPSNMSLVLQMPRGNLETINPRPLVLEIVKEDIDKFNYGKAFLACRKHRIDLNIFLEHNRDVFMKHLSSFVEQIADVDYINLFLTNIGQGSLPDDIVNELCDGIRRELEKRDLKTYVNSVLTAHVMKRPPDHEAGLAMLLRLRETQPQLVEDAVKYIIFLVDADRLFDTALGMYDFSLVLMVAQHAQKDPREYLPFLRELRALEKYYQRFKIDEHLKRHDKALRNLSLTGDDRFDEAMAYVEKHQLYDNALSIWKDTERYDAVLNVYGDWLFERRQFKDAGFVFKKARRFKKAMLAYEKSLDWRELFDIALQQSLEFDELVSFAYRAAEDLSGKKRYQEAARVLLDYAQDVREAIIALVQGNLFSEARRIITFHKRPELLEEIVYPGSLESRAQIADDLGEMKEQLRKQVARLRELRVKKVEEPDAFYGVEDENLHNVDVMTDISMAPTAFTRYTAAPSAVSRSSSKRSSRSKRKMERKIGSGRKGTVDEEEYLLRSITKLVGRFQNTQNDAITLLPHLFEFTEEHESEGMQLQDEIAEFAEELNVAIEEVWKKSQDTEAETFLEGWAARMQEYERQRRIDPLDKVPKPELAKQEWNQKLCRI